MSSKYADIGTMPSRRNDYVLTIYIPSFGRPDSCLDQVQRVCSQRAEFGRPLRIVVAINGDRTYPVPALKNAGADVVIQRPVNLGGNANICLGYEWMDNSDYLWILSDDDAIQPGALVGLAPGIDDRADLIVGARHRPTRSRLVCRRRGDLAQHGAALDLVSASVYRSGAFADLVETAFEGIVTSYPHACLISQAEQCDQIRLAVLVELAFLVDDSASVAAVSQPRSEMSSAFGSAFFGGALASTMGVRGGFDHSAFARWWRVHWHRASMYRRRPNTQQQWADRLARSSAKTLPLWAVSLPPYWKLKDFLRPHHGSKD